MESFPSEYRGFLLSISKHFLELESKQTNKQEMKAAMVMIANFIFECSKNDGTVARERFTIRLPDGGRFKTFFESPPAGFRMTESNKRGLQRSATTVKFMKSLTSMVERQFSPPILKTARRHMSKPAEDPIVVLGRLDESSETPPPNGASNTSPSRPADAATRGNVVIKDPDRGSKEAHRRRIKLRVHRQDPVTHQNHDLAQQDLESISSADQEIDEDSPLEGGDCSMANAALGRLSSSLASLETEISHIPAMNWECYKVRLAKFCCREGTQDMEFVQRLMDIMRICYLPEEIEVLVNKDWDRLEAVLNICVVLAEVTGNEYESSVKETARQWMASKMMDIAFLKGVIGVPNPG